MTVGGMPEKATELKDEALVDWKKSTLVKEKDKGVRQSDTPKEGPEKRGVEAETLEARAQKSMTKKVSQLRR